MGLEIHLPEWFPLQVTDSQLKLAEAQKDTLFSYVAEKNTREVHIIEGIRSQKLNLKIRTSYII